MAWTLFRANYLTTVEGLKLAAQTENGGEKVGHGSGGMSLLRAA